MSASSAAYLGRLGGPPWRPPASRCRPRGCPLGAGAGSHRRLGNSAAASTTLPAPARPPPAGPADLGEQLPPPPFQQPQQEEEEISERELCEDDLLAEEQLLRLQQGSEARTAAAQGYAPAVWAGEEHAQCKVAPGPPAAAEEIASDPNVSYADLLAQEQRLRREAEARMAAAERKQAAAECEIARLRRQPASSLPTAKERRQLQLLREHNVRWVVGGGLQREGERAAVRRQVFCPSPRSERTLKKLAPPGMPKHLTFGRSQRGPKPPPAPQAGAAAAAAEVRGVHEVGGWPGWPPPKPNTAPVACRPAWPPVCPLCLLRCQWS